MLLAVVGAEAEPAIFGTRLVRPVAAVAEVELDELPICGIAWAGFGGDDVHCWRRLQCCVIQNAWGLLQGLDLTIIVVAASQELGGILAESPMVLPVATTHVVLFGAVSLWHHQALQVPVHLARRVDATEMVLICHDRARIDVHLFDGGLLRDGAEHVRCHSSPTVHASARGVALSTLRSVLVTKQACKAALRVDDFINVVLDCWLVCVEHAVGVFVCLV